MTARSDRDEAIRAALFAHDGMERLIREDGLPREAVEPEPTGVLAALRALGFTVTPVALLQAGEHLRLAGQAYWEEPSGETKADFENAAIEWDEVADPLLTVQEPGLDAEELDHAAPWSGWK